MECRTVKVVDIGNEQGFKNINAEDFDPLIHVPFVEPEPEPEPEPAIKLTPKRGVPPFPGKQ